MRTRYYRLPNGEIAIIYAFNENDKPELLLEIEGKQPIDKLPRRCELCTYRKGCWQYEVRRATGRICDIYSPYD